MLFVDMLSLYLVTFLMLFILVHVSFFLAADALADPGVLRWVRSNYPELYPQNILDYVRTPSAAARSSYSCVRYAGNVGGASQLVSSSAQENVRACARESKWLGWGLISDRGREWPRAV